MFLKQNLTKESVESAGTFITCNEAECLIMCFTLKSKLQRLTASLSSFSLRFRFCENMNRQDVSWNFQHASLEHVDVKLTNSHNTESTSTMDT